MFGFDSIESVVFEVSFNNLIWLHTKAYFFKSRPLELTKIYNKILQSVK